MRRSGSRSKSKDIVVEPSAIVAMETMMLANTAALAVPGGEIVSAYICTIEDGMDSATLREKM